ncbi:hypothetical protein H6G35_04560 [Aulosira sp. FACHB-113]|nr:hypothetical protein [Aulosira sp. FACHB-113]
MVAKIFCIGRKFKIAVKCDRLYTELLHPHKFLKFVTYPFYRTKNRGYTLETRTKALLLSFLLRNLASMADG